jgi:hypothetical protein
MPWGALRVFITSPSGLYLLGIVVVVLGIMWLLLQLIHGRTIAALEARVRIAEERSRTFSRIFRNQSAEDVAARMRALEARLEALPPRRLSDDQRRRLSSVDPPPPNATYLAIEYDSSHSETDRFAQDVIEAFMAAPGWNVVRRGNARLGRQTADVAVAVEVVGSATPTETLIIRALTRAGIPFGMVQRTMAGMHAEIVIAPR